MSDQLHETIDRIVAEGEDIQNRVREAVEESARQVGDTPTRLADITSRTIDSAVAAIDRSAPADPHSTLRQVLDGLGDGLSRTAEATKLAVAEAASEGRAYAKDDLKQVASDMKSLGEMFVDTVVRAVKGAGSKTQQGIGDITSHAERTIESIKPSLQEATYAALHDPVGLAGESAVAATKVTREAAGALFGAIGNALQSAGEKIKPKA